CDTCEGTDADGDGYGTLCDCDDTDISIYPGSVEIPDDGRDNDCDGAADATRSDDDGIFVAGSCSVATMDDDNPGTMAEPVATLAKAFELAEAQDKAVFADNGVFFTSEQVVATTSFFGGYDCDAGWTASDARTTLQYWPDSSEHALRFNVAGDKAMHRVFVAADAAPGVVVSLGPLTMVDSKVVTQDKGLFIGHSLTGEAGRMVISRSELSRMGYRDPGYGAVWISSGELLMGDTTVSSGAVLEMSDKSGAAVDVWNGAVITLVGNTLHGGGSGVVVGKLESAAPVTFSPGTATIRDNVIDTGSDWWGRSVGIDVSAGSVATLSNNTISASDDATDTSIGVSVSDSTLEMDGDTVDGGGGGEVSATGILLGDNAIAVLRNVAVSVATGDPDPGSSVGLWVSGDDAEATVVNTFIDPVDAQSTTTGVLVSHAS
ncbi:MAG: putative metal-binding motif-containing protein, partial [Myxococcota bacterium]|nr:putative metal-binding motif-containing protein [Myxococcota bacterium]